MMRCIVVRYGTRLSVCTLVLLLLLGCPEHNSDSTVSVPDVVNMAENYAQTVLVQADLVVGSISREYSNEFTSGNVISQVPSAGASVPTGTAVSLVISKGPAPNPPSSQYATLCVINDLSKNVVNIFITPHGSSSWGTNRLGASVLYSGDTFVISDISAGTYEMLANEADYTHHRAWNISLPAGKTASWSLAKGTITYQTTK